MDAVSRKESVAGAVGLPIAIVALVLAIIPPIAFFIAWVPGLISLGLGVVGLVRSGTLPSRRLSIATLVVAAASFVITAGWMLLGWTISNVLVECLAPTCR